MYTHVYILYVCILYLYGDIICVYIYIIQYTRIQTYICSVSTPRSPYEPERTPSDGERHDTYEPERTPFSENICTT